ncbi:olfactory receptor 8A1-like [Melanotaenia boesemani]|uniref:olfactory receptor 8A1-like n=1 Tax=Melanotaenia boesemani TaxID=1250792 RepID=UPI001C048385|nr:olfactory receptor 8A1-like [Melanotaenia boesemani]
MFEQMQNNSQILIQLQGLNDSLASRPIFVLALTSYVFTVLVNLTLIVTVCLDETLHQPIYVFMCNLCVNGICGASSFYPKLLYDLLADHQVITYAGCMTQMFFTYSYVFCEFTSLTVMAYDRFEAICRPLRYRALMTGQKVVQLLAFTWSLSLMETAVGIFLLIRLPLCKRHIPKVFCTNWEVVKLSCSSTVANDMYGLLLVVLHLLQAGLILVSYVHLVRTAVRSQSDRRKFLQTCLPHLAALLVFTASLLFDTLFSRYAGGSMAALQNALAAEFLVVPPLVNPVIYGVNLQQVRTRIRLRFILRTGT